MILNNNQAELNYKIKPEKSYINESLEIECICDTKTYDSKNKLIKCFLCQKYQHLDCIFQAKFIKPYICFNCQFKNSNFFLRWKKTIISAKEIIYLNKWNKDKALLSKGTKKFKFFLNLNELYELNGKNEEKSHFLAFLWMTNNGKPFHFGFPDNINIKINNNEFYSTDNKGFKYPLLISLDNSNDYSPKKRSLISMDNYEIPQASEFFFPPRVVDFKKKASKQSIIISFENPLENYYGSEFQFEDTRRYLFYLGVFQEIKIPQISLLKNCNKLIQYNKIFKDLYREKVLKMKWNKISNNIVSSDSEEINFNFLSNISNQKIINPVRGVFCQHSEILDFGECCRYISSKNQIYKCYKCNKPLNIMYIDDMSEKLFYEFKDKNFSEIYFNNKFKFIKGEKSDLKDKDYMNYIEEIEDDESNEESDYLNESFFKYYEKEFNLYDHRTNKNYKNYEEDKSNITLINDSEDSNSNSDNAIEIYETISLSSNSEKDKEEEKKISRNHSNDCCKNKNYIFNMKDLVENMEDKECSFSVFWPNKKENNNVSKINLAPKNKKSSKSNNTIQNKNKKKNKLLQKKRDISKIQFIKKNIKKIKEKKYLPLTTEKLFNDKNEINKNKKNENISKIKNQNNKLSNEIIEISQNTDDEEDSIFIPIDNHNTYDLNKITKKSN